MQWPRRSRRFSRTSPSTSGNAFHDGTVGLYFMGFCKEQAPLQHMEAIYGMHGKPHDTLTDYSTPASGSFYFAPLVETLEAALA